MTLFRKLEGLSRDRRGGALVEFTLLAPLLISLMAGVSEFGLAFRQYHIMEKGVRDAGRFLSRAPGAPCAAAPGDWSGSVTGAKTLAITGTPTGSTPTLPSWSDPNTVSVNVNCVDNAAGAWRGAPNLAVVRVTATAPFVGIGLLSFLGLTAPTLSVSHEELKVS
jgi:Flp pilus assembly protein TadG